MTSPYINLVRKKVNTNDSTMIPCAYALDTENRERCPNRTEMKIAHLWLSKNEQCAIAVVTMMTMKRKEKWDTMIRNDTKTQNGRNGYGIAIVIMVASIVTMKTRVMTMTPVMFVKVTSKM